MVKRLFREIPLTAAVLCLAFAAAGCDGTGSPANGGAGGGGNRGNFVMVSAGGTHTLAICEDGRLWGWGSNAQSRTGVAAAGTTPVPTRVGTASDWISVSAGGAHSMALSAGALFGMGNNSDRQLGDGTTSSRSPTRINF